MSAQFIRISEHSPARLIVCASPGCQGEFTVAPTAEAVQFWRESERRHGPLLCNACRGRNH